MAEPEEPRDGQVPQPASSPNPSEASATAELVSGIPPMGRRGGRFATAVVAALCVGLAMVFGTTLLGRTVRSPGPFLAIAVTFLPYLYIGLGLASFLAWCVFPDRRSIPTLLLAMGVVGAVLWGPGWPARPDVADGAPITAMSWNVQRLWGDGVDDPASCVVDAVRDVDPDVVTLLEVSEEHLRLLSTQLGLECVHVDYFATGASDSGGLAVCVRSRDLTLTGSGQRFLDDDDWRYVFAEVRRGDVVFNVMAVHLHPFSLAVGDIAHGRARSPADILRAGQAGTEVLRAQGGQSVALLEHVGRLEDPTLVSGDFNSTRDFSLHAGLRRSLVDTWERGGLGFGGTVRVLGWVPLRVDYIYATGAFGVRDSRVIDVACADHRPVVSDLVIRNE